MHNLKCMNSKTMKILLHTTELISHKLILNKSSVSGWVLYITCNFNDMIFLLHFTIL